MFINYIKVAWRHMTRHKIFTIINVLGLALGVCACLIIYLMVQYESSFDRFHPDKERIYRLVMEKGSFAGTKILTGIPAPGPAAIRQEIPGLEAAAGFFTYWATVDIPGDTGKQHPFNTWLASSNHVGSVFADANLFSIFHFDWLAGNPSTALAKPSQVVLAESRARLYFGNLPLYKVIGRELIYRDSVPVRVSGIVRDWDKNSDFAFSDIISLSTINSNAFFQRDPRSLLSTTDWKANREIDCFIKTTRNASTELVQRQVAELLNRHVPDDPGKKASLLLQPLTDIHFTEENNHDSFRKASRSTLAVLMAFALFILLIAIFNFINLSTAQSLQRAKEIGIRKIMGSSRRKLVFQFLAETFLLAVPSVVLAILFVRPVLTLFHDLIPPGLEFHFLDPFTLAFLLLITLVTTVFAGFYPARVISSYLPVASLKGNEAPKGSERWLLRKGLIVFQFTLSLVFIIGAIVIGSQMNFIRNKDLGLSTDAVINMGTPANDSLHNAKVLARRFRQLTGVSMVAREALPPVGTPSFFLPLQYKDKEDKPVPILARAGDENLIPLYRMRLLAGRNLRPGDSLTELVINETYARELGFPRPEDAVGKLLLNPKTDASGMVTDVKALPIVGVVADVNEYSLREAIKPMVIGYVPRAVNKLAVRLDTRGKDMGDLKRMLAQMEKAWKEVYPAAPFSYTFLDEAIARMYINESRTALIVDSAMIITIFISCLGLFGLALFTVEKKTNEIGIRKVLGAGITDIVVLLSRDFLVLVVLALMIASPIAWYFANNWLQSFVYRISIQWWVFAFAGVGAVSLALITIGFQTLRAALANPVRALRSE
ncbi:ABC transporter permease [Puia dinghuensis]|uniref:ABC transporter permease n=2 Tax=Puia dinghuensis TaxID=1792502 RepID=A0A8J2UDV4_9BACT|nr:ABC transporter permease [Puia dinghuensis]